MCFRDFGLEWTINVLLVPEVSVLTLPIPPLRKGCALRYPDKLSWSSPPRLDLHTKFSEWYRWYISSVTSPTDAPFLTLCRDDGEEAMRDRGDLSKSFSSKYPFSPPPFSSPFVMSLVKRPVAVLSKGTVRTVPNQHRTQNSVLSPSMTGNLIRLPKRGRTRSSVTNSSR